VGRDDLNVAVIVPCHNEEVAIGKVVGDIRAALPEATVYVYDNRSTDRTAEVAARAGAVVRREELKGKGNVVRRAFADIEADVYLLIDGDDTYEASDAPGMIDMLLAGPYDHILGVRTEQSKDSSSYRPGHELGNRAFNNLVSGLFGQRVNDMLSGYRVFSRRFVKSFPAVSREFEIETELTVHSNSLRIPQREMPVGFRDRPAGSESKLSTYRDGTKILLLIWNLLRHERPMLFHSLLAAVLALVATAFVIPVIVDYAQTGLVPRFPTLFTAIALYLAAGITLLLGFILDGVVKARREIARLAYLRYPTPPYVSATVR
jgi:glycosyltransferase involved in cell wall biosynthesis